MEGVKVAVDRLMLSEQGSRAADGNGPRLPA
jgi:hypothetical protein